MTVSWILQGLLAAAFLGAGSMKLARTREQLLAQGAAMAWVEDFGPTSIRLIGVAEVLGAVGLVVPTVTGILPVLATVAAGGLVLLMIGAAAIHVRRGEVRALAAPVALGAMALAAVFLRP
ncbi:MAG: DoxX family protein [Gemmatimonadota bacterium]|nr:DoxX family protein [Gemmatimonadota bacterium]